MQEALSRSDVAVLILSSPEFNPFSLLHYILFIYNISTFSIGPEEWQGVITCGNPVITLSKQ